MCALYGFINYGKILNKKELKKLVRNLSISSELRGTDASGVAYVRNGKVVIYKKPQPSHEVNFEWRLMVMQETITTITHS